MEKDFDRLLCLCISVIVDLIPHLCASMHKCITKNFAQTGARDRLELTVRMEILLRVEGLTVILR